MTMKKLLVAAVLGTLTLGSTAFASGPGEQYRHFTAQSAENLPQAVANFSEYNNKLQAVLDGPLTDADIATVHELTYTLEDALEKINSALEELAETLEAVHQASEKLDREAVLKNGRDYLEVSRQVIK
jgi:predicted RNase H-like HicB family nuclease